jgi:hypothetical protein
MAASSTAHPGGASQSQRSQILVAQCAMDEWTAAPRLMLTMDGVDRHGQLPVCQAPRAPLAFPWPEPRFLDEDDEVVLMGMDPNSA